jgi:nitrogenase subunit NifH
MASKKKLGIWMDHANAHLMQYADPIVTTIISSDSTHEEKELTLQKGESFMQRKNQQQEAAYYKAIAESIKGYDEVLVFGPTNARIELLNILEADLHFSKIKIETKPRGKMTENQEHAFVRNYFSKS